MTNAASAGAKPLAQRDGGDQHADAPGHDRAVRLLAEQHRDQSMIRKSV